MPDYNFKNNLKSTLQAKLWSDATSINCNHVVESADANTRRNAWPDFPFTLTLVNTANDSTEVIKCTGLAGNSNAFIAFTCARAQENTTAHTFEIATTSVEHRLTSGALNSIVNAISTAIADINATNTAVSTSLATHIGSIVSVLATDTYVPNGCVPCNGAEYTRAQFPALYDTYLTGATPKLLTCTYAAFSTQLASTGNCAKFAVDTANQKFRVPMLKDGDSITQAASAAELGKSYKAGLPNITGSVYVQGLTYGSAIVSSGSLFAYESGFNNGVTGVSATNGCSTIGLNAAASSSIYGNATTVRDEQVRLRHFVVLASAQNSSSVFDWSNYMAGLAGKANVDFTNIPLAGKANAGKAMAYALDYDNPVSFGILDTWVYAPVGGLLVGWIWVDPASSAEAGVVTVGNTRVAATQKNKAVNTVSCFIDPGVRVKKDYGVYNTDVVIVPWRTA